MRVYFEAVVTLQNVNRIPHDWRPRGLSLGDKWVLDECKRYGVGFLRFLISPPLHSIKSDPVIVERFLQQWSRHINWDQNVYGDVDFLMCELMTWSVKCANANTLLLLQYGAPCMLAHFQLLAFNVTRQTQRWTSVIREIFTWMLEHDVANYDWWAEGTKDLNALCSDYRARRCAARNAARAILVAPWPGKCKDVARLIARHVWDLRNREEWKPSFFSNR